MSGLNSIEILREHGLHQILFRNAGVGLQFYEPPEDFDIEYEDQPVAGLNIPKSTDSWRQYLIIRRYYQTLEEALSVELARLD